MKNQIEEEEEEDSQLNKKIIDELVLSSTDLKELLNDENTFQILVHRREQIIEEIE